VTGFVAPFRFLLGNLEYAHIYRTSPLILDYSREFHCGSQCSRNAETIKIAQAAASSLCSKDSTFVRASPGANLLEELQYNKYSSKRKTYSRMESGRPYIIIVKVGAQASRRAARGNLLHKTTDHKIFPRSFQIRSLGGV